MTLPLLLAGPIVRRVEPSRATIWLALSEESDVEVWVWPGAQVSAGAGQVGSGAAAIAHRAAARTRRFGAHLHLAVITAVTDGAPMQPGTVHSYDVAVDGNGLRELGLLADSSGAGDGIDAAAPGRLALGYQPDHLPSFVTAAPTVAGLRIAHTSCRKPHGYGADALPWLDDLIQDHRADVDARPQQLFLTGDQIYADDVAPHLRELVTDLGEELLGFDQTVPYPPPPPDASLDEVEPPLPDPAADPIRVPVSTFPTDRRGRPAFEVARFSSGEAASHLFGFGEFVAMHLLAWSPRVWRPLATREEIYTDMPDEAVRRLYLTDLAGKGERGNAEQWRAKEDEARENGLPTSADTLARVQAFVATVPRVARALANCATYMIFDDHEITDDWYLSAPWRTRVLASAMGRSVIRNGLLAYSLCQATGNEPARWIARGDGADATPEQTLLDRAATLIADGAAPTADHEAEVDALLGLADAATPPEVRFHYTVEGPRHVVRVLDTRTRRTYDSSTRHSPPKLVGNDLDAMLPKGPLTDGRELLVVVSPVPLLFPRIFDALVVPAAASITNLATHTFADAREQERAARIPPVTGEESKDVEGWGADEPAFHAMIRRLATHPRSVVLSGDVHFASTLVCDVWLPGDDDCDARIVQCTASAARNEPGTVERTVLRGLRSAQRLLQGRPLERLGWDGAHGVRLPDGTPVSPARRGRLLRSPTFVPADGWPVGTTLDAGTPPDVRYRVGVLRDERPDLGVGAPVIPALPVLDAADPIAAYQRVAEAHQSLQGPPDVDPIRLMVFRSNLGLVGFAGGAEVAVTHALLSAVGDGSTGSGFTRHVLDLARTAAAPPPVLIAGN